MGIPVHIVSGFLGTGKTTALGARLEQLRAERVAVIVNDFGEAGLDEAALERSEPFRITNIPGGCVCCTAPEGFLQALTALLEQGVDRLLIEPTGLARPQDLVDTIRRGPHRDQLELQPVIVLLDPARLEREPTDEAAVVQQQIDAADVLVVNRCDLATASDLALARRRLDALWPQPLAIHWTQHARIPEALWSWPAAGANARGSHPEHAAAHDHAAEEHPHAESGPPRSTLGHTAASRRWPAAEVFSRSRLLALLERLRLGEAGARAVRFKGIFRSQEGWLRLELAGDRLHESLSAFRRDSRADAIFATESERPAEIAMDWLEAARLGPEELAALAHQVEIAAPDGTLRSVDRGWLAALPEGVADVSALFPKREGSAARISRVFEGLGLAKSGQAVVCAADGFASEPVAVEALCEGVLVHSIGEAPLSERQGGPFRLLLPEGVRGAPAGCANVKGVVRIVLRDS